ncbi:universal stress protein [Pedobacter sp. MC2016-15]|uniref:universal stress protein n=1 Tax=Pedobacter sp. MC2016-15 TaxID=2994473 RepID=UPI0022458D66|nr:universal stress protein [Pedobacter sp. MC2016-15]MCX2480512.1 universal stress protein [Pedobacter sp. MC2016-15]
MRTFSIKFNAGNLELDAIVTASARLQRFKVEMITGEPDPIRLLRSTSGTWTIENQGQRSLSDEQFHQLENAIDDHLQHLHGGGKILVLTDFSESALNAARYAAGLTHQLKCSALIIYHSHDCIPLVTTTIAPVSAEMLHSQKDSQKQLLRLKEELSSLVYEQTTVEILSDGRPLIPAVNLITEQQHIGLIVMGMAGKSEIEKVLVGSNTIAVAKETHTSLLVIPQQAVYKKIKNAVFACDLKNVTKTIPVFPINTFVSQLKAALSILYVNRVEEEPDPEAREELKELHQIWSEKEVKYYYTDHENVEEGILDFADENTMDLLITVPKEYGFFERIFHRSLTRNLAYRTHLPLLVFKEDQ